MLKAEVVFVFICALLLAHEYIATIFIAISFQIAKAFQDVLIGSDATNDSRVTAHPVFIQVVEAPREELLLARKISSCQSKQRTFHELDSLFVGDKVAVDRDVRDEEVKRGTHDQILI